MTIIGGPMKGLMDWMMEVQYRVYSNHHKLDVTRLLIILIRFLRAHSHSEDQRTCLRSKYPTQSLREKSYCRTC
jgi:hypothetical protein